MSKNWVLKEHKKTFCDWFKDTIFADESASETLRKLADGPKRNVITWQGYDINKYSFYTKAQDDKSTIQNNGVTLRTESQHFASVLDENPCVASISYFGFIDEIWELNYVKFTVYVFKCKWDSNTNVRTNDVGFTLVDLKKLGYHNDPFIMAEQAKKVFMCKTLVMKGEDDDSYMDTYVSPLSIQITPNVIGEEEADDVHANQTRLRSLASRPPGAERLVVNVDPTTDKADDPHKKKLRTYLGVVARDKVDVTYETWKEVPAAQKDLIWEDIQLNFEILQASDSRTKKKILQTVGERCDVLTAAIGRADHPGRVCAAGADGPARGVNHRKSDSTTDGIFRPDAVPVSIPDAILGTCIASRAYGPRVSTKESCVDPSGNDPETVKVGVEEVKDAQAPVPVPTDETHNTFLAWPTHLVKPLPEQAIFPPAKPPQRLDPEIDDPLYLMTLTIPELFLKPFQVNWDATVFGVFNPDFPLYIKHEDLSEIAHGGQCLSISFDTKSYIKSWMQSSKCDVYLGAYLNGGHWQMVVILPKENLVVWFCSLHNRPDNYLKGIINSVIDKKEALSAVKC
ncbi:hypothetical protein HKD37_01G001093 [Glycine soja]